MKVYCEFYGHHFFLTAVVGSGILGEKLSGDIGGIALLANANATGSTLTVLNLIFRPASDGHFNPVHMLVFILVQCSSFLILS